MSKQLPQPNSFDGVISIIAPPKVTVKSDKRACYVVLEGTTRVNDVCRFGGRDGDRAISVVHAFREASKRSHSGEYEYQG